jgi:hypothetical protein
MLERFDLLLLGPRHLFDRLHKRSELRVRGSQREVYGRREPAVLRRSLWQLPSGNELQTLV